MWGGVVLPCEFVSLIISLDFRWQLVSTAVIQGGLTDAHRILHASELLLIHIGGAKSCSRWLRLFGEDARDSEGMVMSQLPSRCYSKFIDNEAKMFTPHS